MLTAAVVGWVAQRGQEAVRTRVVVMAGVARECQMQNRSTTHSHS